MLNQIFKTVVCFLAALTFCLFSPRSVRELLSAENPLEEPAENQASLETPENPLEEPAENQASLETLQRELQLQREQLEVQREELKELRELIENQEELSQPARRKGYLDTVNIRPELRIISHYFHYRRPPLKTPVDPYAFYVRDTQAKIDEKTAVNQLRFRLNLRTDIVDQVRFTGRLTMFKNAGASYLPRDTKQDYTADLSGAGRPSNTLLWVERAYLDYFLHPYFSFTIGRLPTTDGLPREWLDETPRKSTYPAVMYNSELDGVVLTVKIPDFSVLKRPRFRWVAAELLASYDEQLVFDSTDGALRGTIYQLETEILTSSAEGFLIYDHFDLKDIKFTVKKIADAMSGQFNTPATVVRNPVLGYGTRDTLHTQWVNVGALNLDLYLTYDLAFRQSNGKKILVRSAPQNVDICFGFIQEWGCAPGKTRSTTGIAINVGFRYQLPLEALKKPRLGAEYHKASKNYFAQDYAGDGYGMGGESYLNQPGFAYHLYWTQPLREQLFLRLGLKEIHRSYFATPVSLTEERTSDVTDSYILMNASF